MKLQGIAKAVLRVGQKAAETSLHEATTRSEALPHDSLARLGSLALVGAARSAVSDLSQPEALHRLVGQLRKHSNPATPIDNVDTASLKAMARAGVEDQIRKLVGSAQHRVMATYGGDLIKLASDSSSPKLAAETELLPARPSYATELLPTRPSLDRNLRPRSEYSGDGPCYGPASNITIVTSFVGMAEAPPTPPCSRLPPRDTARRLWPQSHATLWASLGLLRACR